ncbi:MAG: Eco57I restriction-modification methylase domain-containing protein [Planctomycetaceae bacterium]|jgi:hypothetical protein|nr:Eco57I restriction-modification methylase domain-containing protein [Planctomycetaceae bacterium]
MKLQILTPRQALNKSFLKQKLKPTRIGFDRFRNALDIGFYNELLYILGLAEIKRDGKILIERCKKEDRHSASILENAAAQLDSLEKLDFLQNKNQHGNTDQHANTDQESIFNIALQLSLTWINRILFFKLLEAKLVAFNNGNKDFLFLHSGKIKTYNELNNLFFQILTQKPEERSKQNKLLYEKIPYLNSSLFEPTELEQETIFINSLTDNKTIPILSTTILKDRQGKKRTGKLPTLEYLFEFLNAYNFGSEEVDDIQEEDKPLISASVLGLIFEKINGYKDGSFFTPGYITMSMCRETIRKAVVRKFNEVKHWNCKNFDELYGKTIDIAEANAIVNSLKICDPAVGSGHFLVSALNEIIAVKNDLDILQDRSGRRIKTYQIEVANDELLVTDADDGRIVEYRPTDKRIQKLQEALFHEKQTIIENCLFGVDVNPNSVQICRLRLWIELLKNAYYKNGTELETLPNLDINIKCGNSLVSRFAVDADITPVLKKHDWTIERYRNAVASYRCAKSREEKRELTKLIAAIKSDLQRETLWILKQEKQRDKLAGELYRQTHQGVLIERTQAEETAWKNKEQRLKEEIAKLETEIAEIKSNTIFENAFEWRFEFPEVLSDSGEFLGFDVILGNPPYIDAKKLKSISQILRLGYSTYSGTADLYVYFYELGLRNVKSNGIVNFISSNKFIRTSYGENLRKLLTGFKIEEIIDFTDVAVFHAALVASCIVSVTKAEGSGNEISYTVAAEAEDKRKRKTFVHNRQFHVKQETLSNEIWQLEEASKLLLKEKIERKSTRLKQLNSIKVYRGVTTGYNPAFIIDETKHKELMKQQRASQNIIKPVLQGRNIRRWVYNKSDQFILLTGFDLDIENKYPSIFQHLSLFQDSLSIRSDQGKEWYNLRSCQYYSAFTKEKIIWGLTADKWAFAYDNDGHVLPSNGYILTSTDISIKYLLALMNSKLMEFYFGFIGIMTAGGAYTLKYETVIEFPIKLTSTKIQHKIEKLVDRIIAQKIQDLQADTIDLETQIDRLVYEIYELTNGEIDMIEKRHQD